MLEHVEQLLGELGGEVEGEDADPALDEDFEPCSDDDEEEDAEAPMEHWPHLPACILWFHFSPIMSLCSSWDLKGAFFLNGFPLPPAYQRLNLKSTDMHKRAALKAAVSSISFSQLFNAFTEISPYLSNASLNLLDRSLLRNEF